MLFFFIVFRRTGHIWRTSSLHVYDLLPAVIVAINARLSVVGLANQPGYINRVPVDGQINTYLISVRNDKIWNSGSLWIPAPLNTNINTNSNGYQLVAYTEQTADTSPTKCLYSYSNTAVATLVYVYCYMLLKLENFSWRSPCSK